jgi:endoribonuclease Dicer
LLQLLLKASQDKRFVCEEAERTLTGMTISISPQPMLQKLQPYISHRNPRVRAKAAMCMYQSVSRLGVDEIKQYGLESLIQLAASQLNDRLPEAREAARKLVLDLCTAYQKCPDAHSVTDLEAAEQPAASPWEQFCLLKLSPTTAQAVLRVTCIATR